MQQNSELYSVITNREISDAERVKAVERILKEGGAVNYGKNEYGNTALHGATVKGHLEIAKFLIEKGADVNLQNEDGCTPAHLFHLVKKERFSLLQLFTNKGLNVNIQDEWKSTPLHSILGAPGIWGMGEIVELFLDKGIDIAKQDNRGNTLLHLAVKSRYTCLFKPLVEKGADINAENQEGETPLHLAAKLKNQAVVELLVKKGAEIDAENQECNTPLHLAVKSNCKGVVELLLGKAANINIKNEEGKTPLDLAEQHLGKGSEIIKLLQKIDNSQVPSVCSVEGAEATKKGRGCSIC